MLLELNNAEHKKSKDLLRKLSSLITLAMFLVQAIYDKYVPNLEQIATKMK